MMEMDYDYKKKCIVKHCDEPRFKNKHYCKNHLDAFRSNAKNDKW